MDDKDDGGSRRRARVTDRIEGAATEVGALVRQHPVGALAAALGVGYVVGGGLFTRTTSRVFGLAVRMGVRFALMPLLERELAGMASAAAASMEGGDGAGDGGERPQRH
ncbi:MAG TPA: hypothetical protein VHK47_08895 [Polyangia bacterium]|jgi:hypothetical protein|nr:hypothetical protein [Polyangia bacterium]